MSDRMRVLIITLLCLGLSLVMPALHPNRSYGSVMQDAEKHLPTLKRILHEQWRSAPMPYIICGQVEQESRWKEKAQLKTSRELGRGLAQMTITERFNVYEEVAHQAAYRGWRWRDDPFNATYQLTYLVLTDRANYTSMCRLLNEGEDAWAGALVAYNAGPGTVLQRHALAKLNGVDHDHWFGGLDSVALKGEERLLYGRKLVDMRNDYPRFIIRGKAGKYRQLL